MRGCDKYASYLMPVADTVRQLLTLAKPLPTIETITLKKALGRVLAKDQKSLINVPAFDNSAMDGYAINLDSLASKNAIPVSQRIIAGDAADEILELGTCARIFTGAPVPNNANAVVMQEECQLVEEHGQCHVRFPEDIRLQQNIRPLGQDIQADTVVLEQGHKLRPQELGLLASIGIQSIPVYQKLKVAVISTGNELLEPGQKLHNGQIYNSNHYTMIGMLQEQGFDVIDCGTVKDDAELIKKTLLHASERADCIITSGGVSVGEEDHVKNIIEEIGQLDLWKIAIKPGKPFAFGSVNNTPFIGLPGNPSAVFVTFNILVKAFLRRLQGAINIQQPPMLVKADFALHKVSSREQYLFVKTVQKENGQTYLEKYPNQSSGVLSSSSWANGLAKIPVNQTVTNGDQIEFIPFN